MAPKLAALGVQKSEVGGQAFAASASPTATGEPAQANSHPLVLTISTGDGEKNQAFFAEHKLSGPILLQKDTEVSMAYRAQGTPMGYLIDAEGKIASSLTVGADALLALANGNPPVQPQGAQTGEGEADRASRFSSRSLARSKIKRDG